MNMRGGITDTYNEKLAQQTDSITKKYGIVYQNTGCIIDNESIEAQKERNILRLQKPI